MVVKATVARLRERGEGRGEREEGRGERGEGREEYRRTEPGATW